MVDEFTWSTHSPSAARTADADAPTLAEPIAEATAARLRSPVDTTATFASPTRRPAPRVSWMSPAPVASEIDSRRPAEVTTTAGFVPSRIAPSTPATAGYVTENPIAVSADPLWMPSVACEPSCVVVIRRRFVASREAFTPPPLASSARLERVAQTGRGVGPVCDRHGARHPVDVDVERGVGAVDHRRGRERRRRRRSVAPTVACVTFTV